MEEQLLKTLDYVYGVQCRACKSKVLDPDKKKNQVFLDGKCPSCGAHSVAVKKSKKQLKKERKEITRLNKQFASQGGLGSLYARGMLS